MRRRVTPLLSILVLVFSIGVYAPGAYAEVLGDGSLDPSFDPGTGLASTLPPTAGLAIAEQTDGKILIGGYFTSYNGADRSGIVRVNPDGSVDQTFNPGTGLNGPPVAIVPQADGKILVAGSFTEFDGVARGNLLRLNSDGSLDTTYVPAGFNDQVSAMAMLADGDLLIAGPFVFYGATATPAGLVRLNPDTTMDTNFNPATGTAGAVRSILERPDGGVLLGGEFANYGAAARAGIVRIEGNGSLVPSFDPGAGFTGGFQPGLLSLASTDGGVIAAGAFTHYNGTAIKNIAQLNSDGSLNTAMTPTGTSFDDGQVNAVTIQQDGRILTVGNYSTFNSQPAPGIARLLPTGELDSTFNPGTGFSGSVSTMHLQSNGRLLVGGFFDTYDGVTRNGIVGIVTATVPPETDLVVHAKAKGKKLKPGKKAKIVRSVSTNGTIKKAQTHCYLNGHKLKGKDAKKVCYIKTKKTDTNAKIKVKPKCSVHLKIKTKITAKATGADKAKWHRTWKVKNKPRTICSLTGNG